MRARLVIAVPLGPRFSLASAQPPNGAKVELVAETDGSALARLTADLAQLTRRADEQERQVRHLQVALESRVVIEQAVGMLAERFNLNVADAFDLLRRAARDSRRQLRTLATEVTPGRATPPEVVAARGKA